MKPKFYRDLSGRVMLLIDNHKIDLTLSIGEVCAKHIYELGNKKGFCQLLDWGFFGLPPKVKPKHYSVIYPVGTNSRYFIKDDKDNLIGSFVNKDIAERTADELNAKELIKDETI